MEYNNGSLEQIKALYEIFLQHPNVCTDSRTLQKGDVFFALRGERFDANDFVFKAAECGAAAVVFDSREKKEEIEQALSKEDFTKRCFNFPKQPSEKTEQPFSSAKQLFDISASQTAFFYCQDSLRMLQDLASYHRDRLSTRIIGISGTNGKTTTKELISAVLSSSFSTFATVGNFNNHIGVPLSLLSIKPQTEVAIIEMGANHVGEIDFLCSIAKPDMGILTNIGTAHIEGFKSRENIIKTKRALFESVKSKGGKDAWLFVNADDEALKDETYDRKTTYSLINPSDLKATADTSSPYAAIEIEGMKISSQLIGSYNCHNILASYAIGRHFGIPSEKIAASIEQYTPSNRRSQIVKTQNNTLIMDCYNANPSSCKAAIESLAKMDTKHKRVFLGAMRELGNVAKEEHARCVELLKGSNLEQIVLVGEEYREFADENVLWFETSSALREFLLANPVSGSTILIKGSRTTKMETVEDAL